MIDFLRRHWRTILYIVGGIFIFYVLVATILIELGFDLI